MLPFQSTWGVLLNICILHRFVDHYLLTILFLSALWGQEHVTLPEHVGFVLLNICILHRFVDHYLLTILFLSALWGQEHVTLPEHVGFVLLNICILHSCVDHCLFALFLLTSILPLLRMRAFYCPFNIFKHFLSCYFPVFDIEESKLD